MKSSPELQQPPAELDRGPHAGENQQSQGSDSGSEHVANNTPIGAIAAFGLTPDDVISLWGEGRTPSSSSGPFAPGDVPDVEPDPTAYDYARMTQRSDAEDHAADRRDRLEAEARAGDPDALDELARPTARRLLELGRTPGVIPLYRQMRFNQAVAPASRKIMRRQLDGDVMSDPEQVRMVEEHMAAIDEQIRSEGHRIAISESRGDIPDVPMEAGGGAILDAAELPVAVWGSGQNVLLADGEALMIGSPQGVGKTTLAQQLALGLCGLDSYSELLGLPVKELGGPVLYLAMDRPRQARRSFTRMVSEADRELLDSRLVLRAGPPPADMGLVPETLVRLCAEVNAKAVVIDSLKDAAIGLSDDKVGAGYNRARQLAIASGVQIIELHHTRKQQQGMATKPTINDIYGSTWLTSGTGSVILLDGNPGDPVVHFHHVKTPAEEVGPFDVHHDHLSGRSSVCSQPSLVDMAHNEPITAKDAAKLLYGSIDPGKAEIEKARRKLSDLEKAGTLVQLAERTPSGAALWSAS